jgi:hypothetical protein
MFSRRAVLRGLGGVTVGLPFLTGMPGLARAANSGPKRLVIFFSSCGTIREKWRPTGQGRNFQLSEILAPLAAHKDDLLVLDGIDNKVSYLRGPGIGSGDGHQAGMGTLLTGRPLNVGTEFCLGACNVNDPGVATVGWGSGISIDQYIAEEIAKTTTTKFKSLEFGVRVNQNQKRILTRMCYRGDSDAVVPRNDPRQALDAIFADVGAGSTQLETLRAQRKSVLDAVMDDYRGLARRLGGADRSRVDAHLSSIREIEKRIDVIPQMSTQCRVPEIGEVPTQQNAASFPLHGRAQMDILAMALACDLTRVASIQWSGAVSLQRFDFLEPGFYENHHELSHVANTNASARSKLVRINAWYAQQLAYLIDQLKAIPEGDGTVFDNTVIAWVNPLGDGDAHQRRNLPLVLAGGCGGYFDTGKLVEYGGEASTNQLLTSLAHAMGHPISSFGDDRVVNGPLPGVAA